MRLSTILFFGKKPYGIKYRGKHRTIKKIETFELRNLKTDYERTERNMLILRHPYLTVEQSYGHMKDFKDANVFAFWHSVKKDRDAKFSQPVTLAENLIHLRVSEAWD